MTKPHGQTDEQAEVYTPVYLWKVPQTPLSVRLYVDTIDQLARDVSAVVRSLTARGSEIGGLLLGRVSRGASTRVTIVKFQPIPCDHLRSPLYQLSAPEIQRFDEAIEERKGIRDGLEVVGYFRSHTRAGLSLEPEEVAFCKARLGQPHQVALLIRPQRVTPSTGGLFVWENGEMRTDASYLEFPCSRRELLPLCSPDDGEDEANVEEPVEALHVEPVAQETPAPELPEKEEVQPEPAPARTLGPIIHIASRRNVTPFPAPPEAVPVELPQVSEPAAEDPGKPARVGRCSTRVELRPISRRTASPAAERTEVRHL